MNAVSRKLSITDKQAAPPKVSYDAGEVTFSLSALGKRLRVLDVSCHKFMCQVSHTKDEEDQLAAILSERRAIFALAPFIRPLSLQDATAALGVASGLVDDLNANENSPEEVTDRLAALQRLIVGSLSIIDAGNNFHAQDFLERWPVEQAARYWPETCVGLRSAVPSCNEKTSSEGSDTDLIQVSSEIIALQARMDDQYPSGCTLEEEKVHDEKMQPFEERMDALINQSLRIEAKTPEGHAARAKAIAARYPDDLNRPKDKFGEMVARLLTELMA